MNKIDQYDERISMLLEDWVQLKKELTDIFENRDRKNALKPMLNGIEFFLKFLFWSNGMERNDVSEEMILHLYWKPVNVSERLNFIKNRPDLYHSFIQLTELMVEQEKQYNKSLAIKRVTKQ